MNLESSEVKEEIFQKLILPTAERGRRLRSGIKDDRDFKNAELLRLSAIVRQYLDKNPNPSDQLSATAIYGMYFSGALNKKTFECFERLVERGPESLKAVIMVANYYAQRPNDYATASKHAKKLLKRLNNEGNSNETSSAQNHRQGSSAAKTKASVDGLSPEVRKYILSQKNDHLAALTDTYVNPNVKHAMWQYQNELSLCLSWLSLKELSQDARQLANIFIKLSKFKSDYEYQELIAQTLLLIVERFDLREYSKLDDANAYAQILRVIIEATELDRKKLSVGAVETLERAKAVLITGQREGPELEEYLKCQKAFLRGKSALN